ncbi:MAG: hypothetical protein M9894_16285 [Planctomycetes bacterium]|nr:hypothetical protein [Planctomycetota bacterium]
MSSDARPDDYTTPAPVDETIVDCELDRLRRKRAEIEERLNEIRASLAIDVHWWLVTADRGEAVASEFLAELRETSRRERETYAEWSAAADEVSAAFRRVWAKEDLAARGAAPASSEERRP